MEEWKEYKLGDVCQRLKSGKSIKADQILRQGKYPVIGGNGLRGYTNEPNFIGEAAIIGRQGAYCGNVRYFKGAGYMTEHAIVLVGNKLTNTKYLSCKLSLMQLGHLSAQSAQPGLSVQLLSKLPIILPSIEKQNIIANIIQTLDDKIELNRRINENLEQQAQALFKAWFVDFEPFKDGKFVDSELGMIPEGWKVGNFEEFVEVKYGKDHKKLASGTIPVYGSGGIMRYVDRYLYNKESVLIPRKGSLNNVMYVNHPFWTVDTMFYTHMKIEGIAKFIYLLISPKDLLSMNSGSAVPSMTVDILNKIAIIIPPTTILQQFESIVKPFFIMAESLQKENQRLAHLRDTLLPKLMSGELKINDLSI
ncbi:restriction endonuclease subunit S [Phocaeicola sp. HCN-40430]|uniref:restriction endonuclease subunit S n=1 Tax=Phocaeicola sp. HCN-40430 TaxID=3134664 RepID=UPI0030BEC8F5